MPKLCYTGVGGTGRYPFITHQTVLENIFLRLCDKGSDVPRAALRGVRADSAANGGCSHLAAGRLGLRNCAELRFDITGQSGCKERL